MKHYLIKRILSVILIISLNLFLIQVIYATQYEDNSDKTPSTIKNYNEIDPIQNFYSAGYFFRLNRIGENIHGSCGYVALGMLLSYYDSYWADSIIPERYDAVHQYESSDDILTVDDYYVRSPGIHRDIAMSRDFDEYVEQVHDLTDNSDDDTHFHLRLLEIGYGLEYWNNSEGANDGGEDDRGFGLSTSDAANLLEYYFSTYNIHSGITVNYYTSENRDIRAYTIDRIKRGIPVYLGISGEDVSHAVIAYDYDEANDEIYIHTGWDGYPRVKMSEMTTINGYTSYDDAITLSFDSNYPHACSNNYWDNDSNNNRVYMCPCDLPFHPAHRHRGGYSVSATEHAIECFCGEYGGYEDHDFIYTRTSNTRHEITCYGCDYYSSASHTVRGGLGGGTAACIYCGAIVNIGDGFIQMGLTPGVGEIMSDGSRIVTANGSYILPSGVLVLSEADYLLVLKGELDPHALLHDHGQQIQ